MGKTSIANKLVCSQVGREHPLPPPPSLGTKLSSLLNGLSEPRCLVHKLLEFQRLLLFSFLYLTLLNQVRKSIKRKFRGFGKRDELAEEVAVGRAEEPSQPEHVGEKNLRDDIGEDRSADDENILEKIPTPDVQDGVKKVEAVTLTWTKNELILAYGL